MAHSNEIPQGNFRVEGIVPYSSPAEFTESTERTLARKDRPRVVAFTAGAKKKLRSKKRSMR